MKLAAIPRTLRWLGRMRRPQLAGQVRYALGGKAGVAPLAGPVPALRVQRARAVFLGAPEHARWQGESLTLLNRDVRFGARFDWDYSAEGPLWAFHLHQFDYARAHELTAQARATLLLDWIERHRHGVGWSPHPISLRALSWGKLLLTEGALELSAAEHERVRASLAQQIETLDRNLEVRLQANHLLSNLLGVVFGALLFTGDAARAWLSRASWLERELSSQILSDGLHEERSPMYHALLLENLLDFANLAAATPGVAPASLVEVLHDCCGRMLAALQIVTHPDGEIALLGDSAFGIAQRPAAIEAYAASLGIVPIAPPRQGVLERGGIVRLEEGPFTLIASVAVPSPAHQPGHAHCDALSFELSVGTQRIVTDTGVHEYVVGPLRDLARATGSHATVEVAGCEQAETFAAHRIGGRPLVALCGVEPGKAFEATCAAWSTGETLHRRAVELRSDGLEIRDAFEGRTQATVSRLPLAPGLEPRLSTDDAEHPTARIEGVDGRTLVFDLPADYCWRVERTAYFPEFGKQQERACLVGEASAATAARYCIRFE